MRFLSGFQIIISPHHPHSLPNHRTLSCSEVQLPAGKPFLITNFATTSIQAEIRFKFSKNASFVVIELVLLMLRSLRSESGRPRQFILERKCKSPHNHSSNGLVWMRWPRSGFRDRATSFSKLLILGGSSRSGTTDSLVCRMRLTPWTVAPLGLDLIRTFSSGRTTCLNYLIFQIYIQSSSTDFDIWFSISTVFVSTSQLWWSESKMTYGIVRLLGLSNTRTLCIVLVHWYSPNKYLKNYSKKSRVLLTDQDVRRHFLLFLWTPLSDFLKILLPHASSHQRKNSVLFERWKWALHRYCYCPVQIWSFMDSEACGHRSH